MTSNNVMNGIQAGLQKSADVFVNRMKQKLSSADYPKSDTTGRGNVPIEDTVVIDTPQVTAGGGSITISVGGSSAPYAAAFEYGSGIHATKGVAEKYEIWPKKGKFNGVLAFSPERWPGHTANFPTGGKYAGVDSQGRLMFWYVEHPGIEPKPYIVPSLKETKDTIKNILCSEFKAAILLGTKREEIINA